MSAIFPISKFTISKRLNGVVLVAELSDLGSEPFCQIYPDACDLGLTVIGKKDDVNFAVTNTVQDGEGEVRYYELVPTPESLRRVPGSRNVTMHLFND